MKKTYQPDFTYHCNYDKVCPYKADSLWQLVLHKQVAHIDKEANLEPHHSGKTSSLQVSPLTCTTCHLTQSHQTQSKYRDKYFF